MDHNELNSFCAPLGLVEILVPLAFFTYLAEIQRQSRLCFHTDSGLCYLPHPWVNFTVRLV